MKWPPVHRSVPALRYLPSACDCAKIKAAPVFLRPQSDGKEARMEVYLYPVHEVLIQFPVIAFLFTLPYMFLNYRKYGSVLIFRSIIWFSFILYLQCAYYLVILPLPDPAAVADNPRAFRSSCMVLPLTLATYPSCCQPFGNRWYCSRFSTFSWRCPSAFT